MKTCFNSSSIIANKRFVSTATDEKKGAETDQNESEKLNETQDKLNVEIATLTEKNNELLVIIFVFATVFL